MQKLFKKSWLIIIAFVGLFLFKITANADVMPYYIGSINPSSIGVYQAGNNFSIYSQPSLNSKILFNVNWKSDNYYCDKCSESGLFVVFLPKRDLAFLTVIDENEDETWVQISYNSSSGLKSGWLKKDDDYRFMTWRTFFNMYGRKYGLYFMKDTSEDAKILYTSNDEDNQTPLAKATLPQYIKLQSVSGNWMLAIATDIDHSQKIGWLRWRNINGEIFLFPNIK